MSQANAAHSTRAPDLSLVGVNRRSTLPALIDARTGDLVAAAGLEARICHKLDKKCPGIVVHYLTLSPRSTRWRISYCASISDQLPRGSCSLPSCRPSFLGHPQPRQITLPPKAYPEADPLPPAAWKETPTR
jgi:hypothetical protein